MKKEEIENFKIQDFHNVTLTKMNHISEIQYIQKVNTQATVKRINKNEYVDLRTGEIKEYKEHADTRTAHITNMYRTMKKLRYLINANFTGAKNEKFITLTFAEQTNDPEKVYIIFDKFMKRFRYHFKDISKVEYISVIEPHASGNFHLHVLFKFPDAENIGFIDNKVIADIWGQGFTTTKDIKQVDNIGAYLSAYLTDIPLDEIPVKETLIKPEILEGGYKEVEGKAIVKGARLHYYPAGIRIYRSSRGIRPPERVKTTYKKAKEYVKAGSLTYSKSIQIELPEDKTNLLSYEYYNTKRPQNQ